MMLFLIDAYQPGPNEVDHAGRGLAEAATLMQPDPQGLIFEYDGKLVVRDYGGEEDLKEWWGVSSIEEISDRVRAHLG